MEKGARRSFFARRLSNIRCQIAFFAFFFSNSW
jgi:hypothetical protein